MTTTMPAPTVPRTSLDRLSWTVADSWTIAKRDLLHWRNQPGTFLVGLFFPVLMVIMFGYLLGGAMSVPGGGDYRAFLMPGMFALTMAFGLESTFTLVSMDAAKGVTDRFRSLPMSGSAVVIGRGVAEMVGSTAALAVLIWTGLIVGWRWDNGFAAAVIAFGLLLFLRSSLLWVGIFMGLRFRPETVVALQILVWPFAFLSNAFAAPETMPDWVRPLVEWNPLSATVTATRLLFGNPGAVSGSLASENALVLAVAWPLLITAIFLPLAVRRYQRLSR
jgi:ABC-type multidrug transport system permease subunit